MRTYSLFALALLTALGFMLPTQAAAQSLFLGAGLTIPTQDFADFGDGDGAKNGFMAIGGVTFPIGDSKASWLGEGFYGMNNHDYEGDKTNLYGAMGGVVLGFGEDGEAGPYVFGQAGFLVHDYKSDDFAEFEGSETGVAFGGGAGYSIPLGNMSGWAEARYIFGKFDDGNTTYLGIMAGISIPLGGGEG